MFITEVKAQNKAKVIIGKHTFLLKKASLLQGGIPKTKGVDFP